MTAPEVRHDDRRWWTGIEIQVGDRLPARWNGEPCEVEVVAVEGTTMRVRRVEP